MKAFASIALVALLTSYSDDAAAQSLVPAQNESARQVAAFPEGSGIAYVDVERVAAVSAEGKASAKLNDLRSKKSAELETRSKEVQALQNKLSQSASVMNDTARVQWSDNFNGRSESCSDLQKTRNRKSRVFSRKPTSYSPPNCSQLSAK